VFQFDILIFVFGAGKVGLQPLNAGPVGKVRGSPLGGFPISFGLTEPLPESDCFFRIVSRFSHIDQSDLVGFPFIFLRLMLKL
jgi:hypothetical protein